MNIPEALVSVINGVVEKTNKKEAVWNTTNIEKKYILFFSNYGLSLYKDSDPDGEFISVSIIKNDGTNVDSFWINEHDNEYYLLNDLYKNARISALSIDSAISEMLNEINSDKILGKKKTNLPDDIPF